MHGIRARGTVCKYKCRDNDSLTQTHMPVVVIAVNAAVRVSLRVVHVG